MASPTDDDHLHGGIEALKAQRNLIDESEGARLVSLNGGTLLIRQDAREPVSKLVLRVAGPSHANAGLLIEQYAHGSFRARRRCANCCRQRRLLR